MLMPNIERYMTREPYSVGSSENLARAKELMTRHAIRHLPVVDRGELVGMVAETDIAVVDALVGAKLNTVEVARMMRPAVYLWAETPLDEAAKLMAERRLDCVVVRSGQGVEGIFTAVDGMSALADILRRATA
jgi:acetoin utilization protein AcuB